MIKDLFVYCDISTRVSWSASLQQSVNGASGNNRPALNNSCSLIFSTEKKVVGRLAQHVFSATSHVQIMRDANQKTESNLPCKDVALKESAECGDLEDKCPRRPARASVEEHCLVSHDRHLLIERHSRYFCDVFFLYRLQAGLSSDRDWPILLKKSVFSNG